MGSWPCTRCNENMATKDWKKDPVCNPCFEIAELESELAETRQALSDLDEVNEMGLAEFNLLKQETKRTNKKNAELETQLADNREIAKWSLRTMEKKNQLETELKEALKRESVANAKVDGLRLKGHKCKMIAKVGFYQSSQKEKCWWWVGELLEEIPGHELETHCIHIKTPIKPEIVFGVNDSDAATYAIIGQILHGSPINPNFIDVQEQSYRKNALKEVDDVG